MVIPDVLVSVHSKSVFVWLQNGRQEAESTQKYRGKGKELVTCEDVIQYCDACVYT